MSDLRFVRAEMLIVLAIACGCIFPQCCLAQSGEKYALLIGVREYDKNELRTLPFSEADVEGLARILRDAGYRPENVIVMTQSIGAKKPRFAPVAANIRKELELLLEGRTEGDSILIALAGHGVQFRDDNQAYFCPTDARLTDKSTLISLTSIYKSLEGSKANLKLMLVDACRNDPQSDNSRARSTVRLESATRPATDDLPGGVAALFSCSAGERAFEHSELKHGVFFHFVIQGLGGDADFDRDKVITLPELQQYAIKRVGDFVRAEYGVHQTPDLQGKTRGLFPLLSLDSPTTPTAPRTKLRVNGQTASSIQVVRKYVDLIEKQHYSKRKIDPEIARRWIEILLDDFDGGRKYFLQEDVDRLRARAGEIEDKLRLGDVGFVWELFNLWVDRRVERRKWADEWLESEHDFTIAEELPTRRSVTWPKDAKEARDLWRKHVKLAIVYHRAKGYDPAEAAHQASRYMQTQFFNSLRSFDDDGLLETALTALGHSFDPQTNFISAKSLQNFVVNNQQRLVGIGVSLRQDDVGMMVVKILPGGPAARDGRLKVGDYIVGVGEGTAPVRNTRDMKFSDAIDLIRGKVGTPVKLEVIPKERKQAVTYDLTRGNVDIEVARSVVVSETRRGEDRPVKIGYISLPALYSSVRIGNKVAEQSTRTSAGDTAQILKEFNEQGVDVALLDLRFNLGGPLSETTAMLGLFLEPNPALISRYRDGVQNVSWTNQDKQVWTRPLVLLTSRGTGPGPEIIAGVLQDYGRALIIGDSHTSGNGSVQSLFDIGEELVTGSNPPRLGACKITTQLFFLPSGRTNAGSGIIPDVVLPSLYESEYLEPRRHELQTEPVKSLVFPSTPYVSQKLIENLKRLAQERQKVTPEYQEFVELTRKYARQKAEPAVPLDERRYLEQYRARIVPDYGDRYDDVKINRDAYFNEVLAVTLDYTPRGKWLEHYLAATALLRQGKHAEAISRFNSAIEQDPDQPAALFQRSRAHAGEKAWDRAIADLKSCGGSGIPSFLLQDVDLKVGSGPATHLKSGKRVVVSQHNGNWLWVQPIDSPKAEGWVQKTMLAPILPEINQGK